MTDVSLIVAYYDNPQMLKWQFHCLSGLPAQLKDKLSLVFVDDCSPNHPAEPQDVGINLQIYRLKQDIRWNQDACRNIGVKHAPSDWFLMTDMDHIVPRATWESLTSKEWDPDVAYSFSRISAPDESFYKPHPNSWFLNKKLFEAVGGYDERFAGYYGTDGDFKVRLLAQAKEWVQLTDLLIRVPRGVIPDASTTSYTRKEAWDRPAIQKLLKYRALKGEPPKRYLFDYERVV